jgi:hypothetical protein
VVQKVEKKQAEKLINSEMQMTLYIKCPACLSDNIKKNGFKSYTLREPPISPFKPINRPLKTDWYNGTTYNRLF